jgi:predicted dehydrogenase
MGNMAAIRYGIVGGGFISGFQLRALAAVRGIEVAGLVSRRPPTALAELVKAQGLGEGRIFSSIREMAPHVDAIALFAPNFARLGHVREIVDAVKGGGPLKTVICEKPLARNLAEARQMVRLVEGAGLQHIYFENQLHMKTLQATRSQLASVMTAMGPPLLVRSGEEHSGPHNAWFWDPTRQGGGVLSDMGCHCLAVGWYALTPPGKLAMFLEPQSVSANLALLKWGQQPWRKQLVDRFNVDYAKTPAEDFATGTVTYKNPETGRLSQAQFTSSWMYDKQGLRLSLDGLGPGYAFEANTLRSTLELFVGDEAARGVADSESALEKSTASRGLLAVQPNEPDLYGYTDENVDAREAILMGRAPLLDWHYGVEIVRLTMAAYLSAEQRATVDLTEPSTSAALETYVPLIQQGRGCEVFPPASYS